MICFDSNNIRFNFRSVAVIIHQQHILIHRAVGDDFWALPGGRVELFEASHDTVVREMREELAMHCVVKRQLWQVENFFEYNAKKYHELGHYFLVSLTDKPVIESAVDFKGIETPIELIFRWVPLANIDQINLKPAFLKNKLNHLPSVIEAFTVNKLST